VNVPVNTGIAVQEAMIACLEVPFGVPVGSGNTDSYVGFNPALLCHYQGSV
jgi:hypothetical protein